jgi:hypothetical protein
MEKLYIGYFSEHYGGAETTQKSKSTPAPILKLVQSLNMLIFMRKIIMT